MNALDKKSIDSFLRVAGGLSNSSSDTDDATLTESNPGDSSNDNSIVKQAIKEGENLRLILRSNGQNFPAKDNTADENNPQYVVCLAHHAPSDQFILFSFSASTMPCRLIRYDRDGKVIQSDVIKNKLCWSEIDAAALVAAVNKCHEGNAAYFGNASDLQRSDPDGVRREDGEDAWLASEYLRLVPSVGYDEGEDEEVLADDGEDEAEDSEAEKEEYDAIRKVILTELLNTDTDGGEDDVEVRFQHPDPNFLLPLSRSISKELKRWRYLRRNHAPLRSEWPKLSSPSEWEKEDVNSRGEGDQMSAQEKEDFDKIVLGRSAQVEKSVKHCLSSMDSMGIMLRILSEKNNSPSISCVLGKEIVSSIALLRQMQQENPMDWIKYHAAFADFEQNSYELLADSKKSLIDWLESAEPDSESEQPTIDGEKYEFDEELDGVCDIAGRLYDLWDEEDEALLGALGRVVTAVEQHLKAGEQHSFECVTDCIKSEQAFVSSLQMNSKRVTEMNAARLVKLMKESLSDDDDESEDKQDEASWLRATTLPPWTTHNLESHLSFGWYMLEDKHSSGMSFVVDQNGLMTCLRDQINALVTSRPPSFRGESYRRMEREVEFEFWWKREVDPIVDSTLKIIEDFLATGDLHNASIAVLCCLGVFCDGEMLGVVRTKYDNDGELDHEKFIIPKFQEVWRKCDAVVIKVALAYFDTKHSQNQGGSHWFFNALKSGALYTPSNPSDISFVLINEEEDDVVKLRLKACWPRYSHPAASIFFHHGWQHPIFLSLADCTKDVDKDVLLSLRKLEAPIVIKERFNWMKEHGDNRMAIALARATMGDDECMHFLLTNGLANEAMVQASNYKNFKGLVQLSKDLVSTNPCASVLCIQAHILGTLETLGSDRVRAPKATTTPFDNLADILKMAWFTPAAVEGQVDLFDVPGKVPSLRLLTTMTLARAFLCAAASTSEMQAIFEQQNFTECGISPLLATIAIATRASRTDKGLPLGTSIKILLSKIGLLSVRVQQSDYCYSTTDVISGSLTDFTNVPDGFSRNDYLDLVCFLYESAKFLIEEGCRSVFCFTLALFSSVQIGVRTGCESFALDVIGSLEEVEEDHFDFEKYALSSPLYSLSVCFSAVFSSCGYAACQDIQHALLETFLVVKVKFPEGTYGSGGIGIFDVEDDMHQYRVWMAIAYSNQRGMKAAGAALADHIISYYVNFHDIITVTLKILFNVDTSSGDEDSIVASSSERNTVHSFMNSDKRKRVTELERNEMISAFISQTLGTAPFLAHYTIAELHRQYTTIDPLVFNRGLDEAETRLSNISDLTLALSKKSSLFTTCKIMHHVQDNPYTVLELGLSWLRNALSSRESIVLFDNSETLKPAEEGTSNWYEERSYCPRGRPKLAAKALVSVLDAEVMGMLENTPPSWLSSLCNEALVLCRALEVLVEPTAKSFGAFDEAWNNTPLRNDQLPSFLQPKELISIIMDPQWSTEPDFKAEQDRNIDYYEEEDFSTLVPFLDHRVAIAAEYGDISEAAKLCVITVNNEFWTKLSDRSIIVKPPQEYTIMRDTMLEVRRVLLACLHVINGAISRRQDLPGDFVNHAVHMILTMNWFRACRVCSNGSPFVNKHARKFVVSLDHIAKVHEIALAWSDLDESNCPFGPSLRHCLNAIRCISRCIHVLEEGDFKRRINCSHCSTINCSHCCSFRQDGPKEEGSEGTSSAPAPEQTDKPIKKRKLPESSAMSSDFKELEKIAAKLHMKEQCDWCKDAIQRVRSEESNKRQK